MQNPDNEQRLGMKHNLNMFIMKNEETQASSRNGFCFGEGFYDDFTQNYETIQKVVMILHDDEEWQLYVNPTSGLWSGLNRFCFSWFFVPTNSQPSLNEPFSENCYLFAFHIMCLILLDLKMEMSFLHINSMNGYVNQLAGWIIGRKGRNHGIELRTNRCAHANKLTKRLFRLNQEFEWRMALPRFHARYPRDLLRGEVQFDRILITDFFTSIEEIQRFRRFLSPAGRLVTGFQNLEEESKIVIITNQEKFETFPVIQLGTPGSIHESLREHCYMTFKELESDEADMSPHEHSTIDSLHFLALRTLSLINDPMEQIRGCSLIDPSLMHEALWSDNKEASICCASSTIVLEPFKNAILTFKERCDAFVPYILETDDEIDVDIQKYSDNDRNTDNETLAEIQMNADNYNENVEIQMNADVKANADKENCAEIRMTAETKTHADKENYVEIQMNIDIGTVTKMTAKTDETPSDNGFDAEDKDYTEVHSPCLDSLAKVLDTLNETVSQCVGQEKYEKWKNNESFEIPVVHGMMIQHLQSVCLFVQYSKVPFRCYCPKEVVLARNANCFHVRVIDSDRTISLSPRLINRMVKEFEGLNTSFFSLELPYYCHELKTRRTQVDLALCCAKFFCDMNCVVWITKLMFTKVKEKLKNVPENIRGLETIIKLCSKALIRTNRSIMRCNNFDSVSGVQSTFSLFLSKAQELHSHVLLMSDHLRRTDVMMELVRCSSILLVDLNRNSVGCRYPDDRVDFSFYHFMQMECAALDEKIYENHINCLFEGLDSEADADAIFSYMARRFVWDLQQIYWRVQCECLRQKTKKLEEDPCFYYQQSLLPYLAPNEAKHLLSLEEDGIDALID